MTTHEMRHDSSTGPEHVFICDECGRRLVVGGINGYTVIDRGDELIPHHGSTTPGLSLGVEVQP